MGLKDEETMPLREAAQFCRGGRPSIPTMWRWCVKGVGRSRTRLEHIRVKGDQLMTSKEAVWRFEERRAQDESDALLRQSCYRRKRTVRDARAANEAAERFLVSEGL